MAKPPSRDECYRMIRFLKQRNAKGDGEKIAQLEEQIREYNNKQAELDLGKFFPEAPKGR